MLGFKQEVVLALLRNTDWMPRFSSPQEAAEYIAEEVPTTEGEGVALQAKVMGVLVNETADAICKAH